MPYTDDFNRTESPLSGGGTWTDVAYTNWDGMQAISNLYATGQSAGTNNGSRYNVAAMTNPSSTVVIYRPGTQTDDAGAMIWKSTGGYVFDHYTTAFHLNKVTSGDSWTENGSGYSAAIANGDTLRLYIDPADNHVKASINGTGRFDWDDTTYRTTLYPGIYSFQATTVYLCLNSWEGEDLAAGGGPYTAADAGSMSMAGAAPTRRLDMWRTKTGAL